MTGDPLLDVRQHETHEQLVGWDAISVAPRTSLLLDAIIIPASRPASQLGQAITLARAMNCTLVVICSRQARASDVTELLGSCFTRAIVADLPRDYAHPLLEFFTAPSASLDVRNACAGRDSDLSIKRNLGLVIARLLRWRRIFFMDDDIRDVSYPDLDRTVSMLAQYRTVGMTVPNFPDNSVVCHAYRAAGAFQDVFVSGAALAVDCKEQVGFFPDIYNEDWFFFYDDAAKGRLGCSGREVRQLSYDPFDDPQRAARQEFGDVLAEGLYALLHLGLRESDATRDYWVHFLAARRRFLESTLARLADVDAEKQQLIAKAVDAARMCLREIRPELCEDYIRRWRRDLYNWGHRYGEIPRISDAQVLSYLELSNSPSDDTVAQGHESEPASLATPGPALIPRVATLSVPLTLSSDVPLKVAVRAAAFDVAITCMAHVVAGVTAWLTRWPTARSAVARFASFSLRSRQRRRGSGQL